MDDIKTYSNVKLHDQKMAFEVKRMEDIYEAAKGKADQPHRHDFYIIILVEKAKGKHIIDFNAFELDQHQVYFLSPGQVHHIIEDEKSYGYVFTFTTDFIAANNIQKCFIDDMHLFQNFGYSPPLTLTEEEFQSLQKIAQQIQVTAESDIKYKEQAIGAWLKIFLINCNNICALHPIDDAKETSSSVSILKDFKEQLEKHYSDFHKVKEYADKLYISPDYLNSTVKSLTGKTAKEHIQEKILVNAKRMLRFSDMTNKEIAHTLGFSEPANFSQFFKNQTQVSPSVFKKTT